MVQIVEVQVATPILITFMEFIDEELAVGLRNNITLG
jgi:hypothetical protein